MGITNRTSLERISLGETALPIRFLGMGIYLAWLYSAHFGMTLFPNSNDGAELSLTFFVSNGINALCLIICAAAAPKLSPLAKKPGALWLAGISSTLGTLLTAANGLLPFGQIPCLVLGSTLVGVGTALLILLWSEFYASLPMRRVSIYYSLSFILATFINYLVAGMPPLAAIIITSILPAASVVMLFKSMAILPADDPTDHIEDNDARWTFPFRPVLLMAVYSFAFNFIRQSNGGNTEFGMIGVGLIALIVLIANVFFFARFDTRLLYRIALPLMVAALLIQPLFGMGGVAVADILANASYAGFVILTMIILSSICFRFGVNALWLFGITRAARVIANMLGAYVGKSSLEDSSFVFSIELMIIVVVLVTASMLLLNDKDFKSTWGITPQTNDGTKQIDGLNYYDTFLGRCAQIARQYGLTHREEEVLALLAQGKTVPAIEAALVISHGTAKSHVRHIYTKLDIHSRDELIAIVGMHTKG